METALLARLEASQRDLVKAEKRAEKWRGRAKVEKVKRRAVEDLAHMIANEADQLQLALDRAEALVDLGVVFVEG